MQYAAVHANTTNIGDDIQSLAAQQFLPRIDLRLDRDDLSTNFQRDTKVIFNGWWAQRFATWPPRGGIIPLFIGMHITEDFEPVFLAGGPYKTSIGTRDADTLELLRVNSIESYLSYCLTLTFPRYHGVRSGVVANDVHYIKLPWGNITRTSHHMPKLLGMDPESRAIIANEMLDKYRTAKFVVTSRLHCVLPCLAFGTPVVFVIPESEHYNSYNIHRRISGYQDILNIVGHGGIVKIKIDDVKVPNIDNIRDNLIKTCREFIL